VNAAASITVDLKRRRRRFILSLIARTVALLASVLFGFLAVLQIVFAAFPWTVLPIAGDVAILMFIAAAGFAALDAAVIRKPSLLVIADMVEKTLGLKPRWISLALELASPAVQGSGQLKEEVLRRAAQYTSKRGADIRRRVGRFRSLACALSVLAWMGTSAMLSPKIIAFWNLPFSMGGRLSALITPGSVAVPLRSEVTLRCAPATKGYPSGKIILTDLEAGASQTMLLRPDSCGAFSLRRDSVGRSFAYRFSVGATVFPAETVCVLPPPRLSGLRIRLIPPAYVGGQASSLPEGQGNFSAYAGTAAEFRIDAPQALRRADFRSSRGENVSLSVTGKAAKGGISVKAGCRYTFSLTDSLGQTNDSLPTFSIELMPDLLPLVQILKPGGNKELSVALVETLWVEALDDIGLTRCSLMWRKNADPPDNVRSRVLLREGRREKDFRTQYVWDIGECSLYPGDTLFYWAVCRDNNPFDTARTALSPVYWFRLPTFEEIHERIVRDQGDAENALQTARKREETISGAFESFAKSTRGKQSLSWEEQQIAKDLRESLRAQSDTIAKAALSLKRSIENLKEQGFSGKDIIDKMENIRKALEEIAREYGDSLLFNPLDKNASVNMNELKQSLEKFQKMLPDLSKRLDNALKYLEMLKRDRKIAALAAMAEKYGKEQSALAQSPPGSERFDRQEKLSEKVDGLLDELTRASDKKSDSALFSNEALPSLAGVRENQRAMRAGRSGKKMPDPALMNRTAASLLSMAQELSDMQSSAMMRKLAKEKEMLLELSRDALSMAGWQEQIHGESGEKGSGAQSEQAIRQALMKSAEKLNRLSMTPPQLLREFVRGLDAAAASMDNALEALKNGGDPSAPMEGGEENLNALSYSFMRAARAMDGQQGQGGECGGMMCGLQRLSGKQAAINAMTGDILRGLFGEGQGQGEQGSSPGGEGGTDAAATEKARQQARAAQQAVADELRKLAEKYGKDADGGLGKKARDLEEEAKRLADMLQNPRPEIKDRQDRFLSRMLQATLSMHKQDEGKEERKSRSATNGFSEGKDPTGWPARGDKDTFFRIRQKAFSDNFPESYRMAVKNYFDSLGVLYLHEIQ
jgi:hypothetical protein